jgi:Domain of unknown function (DUF6883)
MKLPHPDRAIISREKIVDYLLSTTHPDGRDKATFFGQFGFHITEWQDLADSLRAHAVEHEIAARRDSPFGIRYAVEGELTTPRGRRPVVRSVWIVDSGSDIPRLISAYPLKEPTR